jgi:hypothetical protein
MTNEHEHDAPAARTKNGEITLDQLGEIQPGMARIMMEVSDRYWIAYHAARAGNWKLANHELGELKKAFGVANVTRPKYAEDLAAFTKGTLADLDKALKGKDWSGFDRTFQDSIAIVNDLHKKWGHGEIVWQLPAEPPRHLKL